ncbi:MAG: 16S rRNA (adenine1518-N6/adenine1519-N6)-dimethyltransferase [Flavobacteriales bacterium]|jgi:16S rRNA (adenine1518-N6/adenine1519-N6)-dimethyltransferase
MSNKGYNNQVKAKKHLGQHFLNDVQIAKRIGDGLLNTYGYTQVLEIGPGTGALTTHLLERDFETFVIEIDDESVGFLKENFKKLEGHILERNFLKLDPKEIFDAPIGISGNFPYNISTQIMFSVYEHKDMYVEVCGMFQKEVAERIASKPGSKVYGILSVLMQAYFDIEYLFTVDEHVFIPPPRVKSGVIRLVRNNVKKLDCNEKLFKTVVKTSFGQRRKTLRNSLKSMWSERELIPEGDIWTQRPEQLGVSDFVYLTNWLEG